jgi:hypothetical protein
MSTPHLHHGRKNLLPQNQQPQTTMPETNHQSVTNKSSNISSELEHVLMFLQQAAQEEATFTAAVASADIDPKTKDWILSFAKLKPEQVAPKTTEWFQPIPFESDVPLSAAATASLQGAPSKGFYGTDEMKSLVAQFLNPNFEASLNSDTTVPEAMTLLCTPFFFFSRTDS